MEQWDYSLYQQFKDPNPEKEVGGSIVFITRIQKNVLTDIRVVFARESVIRDKNSEAVLSGKHLPLDRRDAAHFLELWKDYLSAVDSPGAFMRAKILNFIDAGITELAD
jgi:hypothetical protein